jgi:PAS domain S-box-containing protein
MWSVATQGDSWPRQELVDELNALRQRIGELESRRTDSTAFDRSEAITRPYENIPVGLAFVDAGLKFVHVNDWLAGIHGKPAAAHIGKTISEVLPETARDIETAIQGVLDSGQPVVRHAFEASLPVDDDRFWSREYSVYPVLDEDGAPRGVNCLVDDVTHRRRAEEDLRRNERHYRNLVEKSIRGVMIHRDGRALFANQAQADIFGYDNPEEIMRVVPVDLLAAPADRERTAAYRLERLGGGAAPATYELRGLRKDGETIWVENRTEIIEWEGAPALQTAVTDITKRMVAELALKESEKRFRNLVANSIQGVLIHRDHKPLFANQALADMFGYDDAEEMQRLRTVDVLVAEIDRDRIGPYRTRRLRGEEAPENYEFLGQRKDGRTIWMETRVNIVDWGGSPAVQSIVTDISTRKEAELALKESERRLKDFAEAGSDWYWETDSEHRFCSFVEGDSNNPAYRPGHSTGRTRYEVAAEEDRETHAEEWCQHLDDLENHRPFKNFVYAVDYAEDGRHWFRISGVPIFDQDGEFSGYRGVSSDITADVSAMIGARSAREQVAMAIDSISELVSVWDGDDRLVLGNRAWRLKQDELDAPSAVGTAYRKVLRDLVDAGAFPDAVGRESEWIEERLERRRHPRAPYERLFHTGETFLISDQRLPEGGIITITTNISDRKKAEEESEQLRLQLFQAQRMETIGVLAGGIAHDFNNILAPIAGYAELLSEAIDADNDTLRYVEAIENGAARATSLVKQILSFARFEMGPQDTVSIDAVVAEALELLRAALPSTIEIRSSMIENCAPVMGDPTQIHQVLMNLCTNAANAMGIEQGVLDIVVGMGEFTPDTAGAQGDLPPGRYVKISVSDDGCGMAPDIQQRVFEPFFTTGKVGHGTGLGLSVVHGIVSGHGGHIEVSSEVGKGTTIDVYLPAMAAIASEANVAETTSRGGQERVLVIDDETTITNMIVEMLSMLGYDVTTFNSSVDALQAFEAAPNKFDVVVTDRTMPGISGDNLARDIKALRGDIPIVMITGYAGLPAGQERDESPIDQTVMKPFTRAMLNTAIREALGQGG